MRSAVQVAAAVMERPRDCGGRFWAASRAKAAHNRRPQGRQNPNAQIRCPDGAHVGPCWSHGTAITEPHPRLRDCWPDVFRSGTRLLRDRGRFKLVVRKPSRRGLTLHDSIRLTRVLTIL